MDELFLLDLLAIHRNLSSATTREPTVRTRSWSSNQLTRSETTTQNEHAHAKWWPLNRSTSQVRHFQTCSIRYTKKKKGACAHCVMESKFNGSHFGLSPSSIHRMTGVGGNFGWTLTYMYLYIFLRDKQIERMVNMRQGSRRREDKKKDVSPRGFISCRKTENGRVGG